MPQFDSNLVNPSPAWVYLVGAGPGDPGMLTLRGKTCLERADVVLFDYLVNPTVLEHANPDAELIGLGSHAQGKLWSQDQINQEMVRRSRSGQTVVRLKGGDPAVFARGAEEAEHLLAAEIPFEIVPGITVALAAGSCAGIPVTHRDLASAVAFVTGHEQAGPRGGKIDYASLAKFPGTLVFYMGTTTVRAWTQGLLDGGMPKKTPVAIIRRCSFPDQTRQHCTLSEVVKVVESPVRLRPPVIFVVGEVTRLSSELNWFEQRPLFGQTIWLTRPADQARDSQASFRELGAATQLVPAIEIEPPGSFADLDQALRHLERFDWIVFSSSNGVQAFCKRLSELGWDARRIGRAKLAAIGPGTARALKEFQLNADLVPAKFEAETLAVELAKLAPQGSFLLIRANRGREVLYDVLAEAGAEVTQVIAYNSRDRIEPDQDLQKSLENGDVSWVTVTSSAIARALSARFQAGLHNAKLASISPITSATLRELGLEPAAEATTFTIDGLIEAILLHERSSN